ncbi:MAG TPA: hypothetical protein PLV13_06985 [Ilumatobacteraceae bacterium]|nr:hypothetical protein [Ilumatobacteraceae bacterium]
MSNPDEVAALNETLDLLSDVEASAQLAEARNEVVRGDFLSSDDLRAKYVCR